MENKKAFPGMEDSAFGQETGWYYGMSLRDYFANSAMQGICSDGHTFWDSQQFQGNAEYIAQKAFEIADAMLKESSLKPKA